MSSTEGRSKAVVSTSLSAVSMLSRESSSVPSNAVIAPEKRSTNVKISRALTLIMGNSRSRYSEPPNESTIVVMLESPLKMSEISKFWNAASASSKPERSKSMLFKSLISGIEISIVGSPEIAPKTPASTVIPPKCASIDPDVTGVPIE